MRPELLLVHEAEEACRRRLEAGGFARDATIQISSYLAQSTDIRADFAAIAAACDRRGLDFTPVELDDAAQVLADRREQRGIVWTLTDGIAYFRGGAAPALARLNGLATIGADDSLFALCQDKFRSGAVLRQMGLPVPQGGLARNGRIVVEPPPAKEGWFVKPNRLGAKIGIWPDSRADSMAKALELSRRIFEAYRDDALIQPYVPGRNARGSYIAAAPMAGADDIGVAIVDSGGDFQTMDDSMALYGDTGEAARLAGVQNTPRLVDLGTEQPESDRRAKAIASAMMDGLGLKDVFSFDLRVEADDTVHLIEFEVCPGLPCFDFRDYCRRRWDMSLAEAIAATAVVRLGDQDLAMHTAV